MKVVVAGGGIGGLTLAQGLMRRGVRVEVIERDIDVSATGGYRLHLSPAACQVLERELSTPTWGAIVSAASPPDAFEVMHVTDRRMRLLTTSPAAKGRHLLIGRVPLRRALAAGLGDSLRLGARVTGFQPVDTWVYVRCVDGSAVEADLLVAADGVGSVVAGQAAGRATSQPVGLVGLAGRTRGLEPHDTGAPTFLAHGPALAIGTGGVGMFITRHEPRTDRRDPADPDGASLLEPSTWVWGLILAQPADDTSLPAVPTALARMDRWTTWARDLVTSTDPDQLGTYRFHAGDPRTTFGSWTEPRVTALGDAVHAMPPTGGQSASTAIEDAGDLLHAIDRVRDGASQITDVLRQYERRVVTRARPRVRESLTPARWIARTRSPLASAALTGVAAGFRAARVVGGRTDR